MGKPKNHIIVANDRRYEIGWAAMLKPIKIPQRLKRAEMLE